MISFQPVIQIDVITVGHGWSNVKSVFFSYLHTYKKSYKINRRIVLQPPY